MNMKVEAPITQRENNEGVNSEYKKWEKMGDSDGDSENELNVAQVAEGIDETEEKVGVGETKETEEWGLLSLHEEIMKNFLAKMGEGAEQKDDVGKGEESQGLWGEMTEFMQGEKDVSKKDGNLVTPDALKKDDNLMTFLVTQEKGYAVEREKAVDTFIEGIKNAKNGTDFKAASFLGSRIVNGRIDGTGKGSEEQIRQVEEFKKTPIYREKEMQTYIEDEKRNLERKAGHLAECVKRIDMLKKRGAWRNRVEIKATEQMAERVKNGIQKSKDTLALYTKKLEELKNTGDEAIDFDFTEEDGNDKDKQETAA